MSKSQPTVTVFSSIPEVAESLLSSSCSDLPLCVIRDDALSGYGGTVEFDPTKLSKNTLASLQEAEILISEPSVVGSLLKYDSNSLPNLKWCQSTYAGVDPLFRPELSTIQKSWILTRFAGAFGPPIAEWCLARIIEHERSFAASALDQTRREWAGSQEAVTQYRYLSSLSLTVLGCGDIGRCVVKMASMFGMRTIGYGKSHRNVEDIDGLDEYTQDLRKALQAGDYIVSVLPSTQETRGLLSGEAFACAHLKNGGKCPVFLNVGRGDVISEESIIAALDSGCISAAILDVFEKEPLPRDSPLWKKPGVTVSPHVSGLTRASDVPKLFLTNFKRYVAGEDLLYSVNWDNGY